MRIAIAISGAILAVFAGRVHADDIPVTSRIETVTVFPAGAEATRTARLSLGKGEHTLVFNDLPAEAVPGSIRVDGKATAGLDIQSVDTRRRYIPRADQETLQAERKAIEDEIEKLRDERGIIQGQEDAAQTQKTLLQNLAQMPGRPVQEEGQPAPTAQPVPHTDWQQILSLIGSGMPEAQRLALDAEVKKRDLDRRIEELEKKLAALAPARAEQTEVKVFVVAGAALEADMTVRYQVRNASWTPHYDARLATGSKTTPPLLELTRRADIVQRTGESWDNVALQLSTTRPTANASAPVIDTVTVDFEPEAKDLAASASAPPPAPMAAYDGLEMRKKSAVGRGLGAAGGAPAESAPDLDVVEQGAAIVAAPFQAVFGVPGRLTVPPTGEAKRVFLQEDSMEPVLTVRTVPKLEAKAYLYAKLILPKGAPMLAGPVSLFRDDTFVGTGALPVLSPGEDHELGFGADDQVRVRHAIADEKRGETGLISSARTDSRNYRITIKNMHERAVELVVHDHIPVSQNDDIKVELIGPVHPTKKDIDGKRGVLAFESKLEPEEERLIEFGYRVIWPGSRAITYH
jgi:uncharacterized protein (TIGR02231 family)